MPSLELFLKNRTLRIRHGPKLFKISRFRHSAGQADSESAISIKRARDRSRIVASLDRKRLGAEFRGGGESRSDAFSIKASGYSAITAQKLAGEGQLLARPAEVSAYGAPIARSSQIANQIKRAIPASYK
jgi:hypothetical protein